MTDEPKIIGDYREWTNNNNYHRIGGPARMWDDGSEEWYINDKLHRIDGPAEIYAKSKHSSDTIEHYWYINDIDITYEVDDWIKRNKLPKWPDWTDETKALFKLTFA